MFGPLPAAGWFARHAKNIEMTNVQVAMLQADARPAFHLEDVQGADFFRMKLPGSSGQFGMKGVSDFRVFGCRHYGDLAVDETGEMRV
jgi:hypothetical protein